MTAFATCLMLPVSATAEEETPLGRQMESLDDAYKGFRREKDPAKGAMEARAAQEALAKSFAEIPEMVAKMPDGPAKAQASAEYRKMLGETYVTLCKVELAFLSGKVEEVAALVSDLKAQKKAGHEKFIEEE
jgi:hypothetical protein